MKRTLAVLSSLLLIGLVASLGSDLVDSKDAESPTHSQTDLSGIKSLRLRNQSSQAAKVAQRGSPKKTARDRKALSDQRTSKKSLGRVGHDDNKQSDGETQPRLKSSSQKNSGGKAKQGQGGSATSKRTIRWRKNKEGRLVPVYDSKVRAELEQSADKIADQRGTVLGVLETVSNKAITGYAYDWKKPEQILAVDIYIDGFLVKTIQANQSRAGAGAKSPLYSQKGFATGPIEQLKDGVKHTVQAFAHMATAENNEVKVVELAGSPRTIGGATLPHGRIENVQGQTVTGWALDPGQPNKTLEVELIWDGESQGRFAASSPTPVGYNPSPSLNLHWFQLELPEHDEKTQHTLQIIVRRDALQRELDRSPWLINKDVENENKIPYGALTFANDAQISGWALDPDIEDQAISVDIYIDGDFLERPVADKLFAALIHRPDVKNPNHLWIVDIPEKYKDGKEHSLSVFAVNNPDGANPELSGSPRFFRSEVNNNPIGYVDVVNTSVMGGWAYDADAGAEAIDIEIWIDGALWKVLPANGQRADLVPVVCPEAGHGWSVKAPESLKDGKFHVVRVYARNTPNGPKTELSRSPRELAAKKPYLGVSVQGEAGRGLKVTRVFDSSPAQVASIQLNDIITSYNNQSAQVDPVVFEQWVLARSIDEAITLMIDRDVSIETPLLSSLAPAIKTQIEAFESEAIAGGNPSPKTIELGDGRKVHLQSRDQIMVQSWSNRISMNVYPVLKQQGK
ncbi:MAG: PDZ domain-containing protein [Planctomycetota bacterium]|nr:PDZ domain-containing protein [Planctomycetota bacterium]